MVCNLTQENFDEIKRMNLIIKGKIHELDKLSSSVEHLYHGKFNKHIPKHVVIITISPCFKHLIDQAFYNKKNISHINRLNISWELRRVGVGFFFCNCLLLELIQLPTNTQHICAYAFDSCLDLKCIDLSTNIEHLE